MIMRLSYCLCGAILLCFNAGCTFTRARNATINACRLAKSYAGEIGETGFTFISGMAHGIDAAAYIGSLKTRPIAVFVNGIGSLKSRENNDLFSSLIKEATVLLEMPFATQPSPKLFPMHNCIIASVKRAILIIEAVHKLRSPITAQEAAN